MANYESHHLYAQGLKDNLMAVGVIEELPGSSHAKEIGNTHMLHFRKCNEEKWEKELKKVLEHGVIDFGKKKPDGSGYGVRRDYTPEEQAKLEWWPVQFRNDGNEMMWLCTWTPNDTPAFYASLALPDQTLIYDQFYEGAYDGGCYLKGGKNIAIKPGIIASGTPKEMLEAAIDVLRAAKLDGFVDEMVNRYMSVCGAEDDRTIGDLQVAAIIADYVYFIQDEVPQYDPDIEEPYEPDDGTCLRSDNVGFDGADLPF